MKTKKIFLFIISLALCFTIISSAFCVAYADGEGLEETTEGETTESKYMTLANYVMVPEETISVHISLPEEHTNLESDWIGIYHADAPTDQVVQNDSMGIWCYIGSATKQYGLTEEKEIDIEIDNTLAEVTTWSTNELNWPLEPGEYKVVLFYADSYIVEDAVYFTIEGDSEPEPTDEPEATDEPAATEEPVVTEEPAATDEPEATDAPEEKETTEETSDKTGCGSLIASGFGIISALLGAAVVISKKK